MVNHSAIGRLKKNTKSVKITDFPNISRLCSWPNIPTAAYAHRRRICPKSAFQKKAISVRCIWAAQRFKAQ